ncbi:hypothetical protein ACVWWN_003489 [Mycobacterium sp. URHB0021]
MHGLRFLVRKNTIDEFEGEGIFADHHTMRIKSQDVDTQISIDPGDHRHRRHPMAADRDQPWV